jgi:hypothetical protein
LAEYTKCLVQLIGLRSIFGVENDQEFATRELQRIIASSRFSSRLTGRDDDNLQKAIHGRGVRGI